VLAALRVRTEHPSGDVIQVISVLPAGGFIGSTGLGPIVPTPAGYARGIVRNMTQSPESRAEPTIVKGQYGDDDRSDGPRRLSQVVAWVVIVAGVVFVVAVISFSRFFLGWSSGDHYGRHRSYGGWHRGYGGWPAGTCPMMEPGGMMGPGGVGPGGPMGPHDP
jgi:hypothetical protein